MTDKEKQVQEQVAQLVKKLSDQDGRLLRNKIQWCLMNHKWDLIESTLKNYDGLIECYKSHRGDEEDEWKE